MAWFDDDDRDLFDAMGLADEQAEAMGLDDYGYAVDGSLDEGGGEGYLEGWGRTTWLGASSPVSFSDGVEAGLGGCEALDESDNEFDDWADGDLDDWDDDGSY